MTKGEIYTNNDDVLKVRKRERGHENYRSCFYECPSNMNTTSI